MKNSNTNTIQEAPAITSEDKKSLEENIDLFQQYGGFDLLEGTIEGVQNLNPSRKARKNIFLTESNKKEERSQLKKILQIWATALKSSDNLIDIVDNCEEKSVNTQSKLKTNLKNAIEEIKELETSYRTLAMFFKNTEEAKVKNLAIVNAELDQLKDLDNTRFIDHIQEELVGAYDRLDLRDNYGLLIVPGYLGSKKVIEKWAKIAHDNKVMLVTDFQNFEEPDDVMEMFEEADLTGGDTYLSNIIMTCNWLVGRGKYNEIDEEEHLFIPPSTALGGKIYNTLMSQITAGKKHGGINEVDGVRFDLKKSEIADLENLGLVPMVNEYGKIMAFSGKTLFSGDNLGLQTYSVVRVFDYVSKVLMDFLNRRAFENFNSKTRKNILSQIVKFLDEITGPEKLIEDFDIKRFEQDPNQKDRIFIDIRLKPYFPAKNFLIKMEGQKGDEGTEWDTEYEAQ